jgi:phage terminase large subunit
MLADEHEREIYVYDEFGASGMSTRAIRDALVNHGFGGQTVWSDSAEPRTISELQALGCGGVTGVSKETVVSGIRKLQDYRIIVHPTCGQTETALLTYAWSMDRNGRKTETPEHDFSHFPDAIRYGACRLSRVNFSF